MYLILKRIFDIILSSIAIILLSPILILIIIILKLTGEGEIFYLQERVGYKTKSFMIYKFATMVKNSPNIGTGDVTLRNDPRVTKAGKFLRESKLNELPQLFNILPKYLRNMSKCGVLDFKEALDKFLTKIPDQPKVGGLIPSTCDLFTLSPSNSLVDQVREFQSRRNIYVG